MLRRPTALQSAVFSPNIVTMLHEGGDEIDSDDDDAKAANSEPSRPNIIHRTISTTTPKDLRTVHDVGVFIFSSFGFLIQRHGSAAWLDYKTMCCYFYHRHYVVEGTLSACISIRNRMCAAFGADVNNLCDIYADDNRQCHGQCAAVFWKNCCLQLGPMLLSERPTQRRLRCAAGSFTEHDAAEESNPSPILGRCSG